MIGIFGGSFDPPHLGHKEIILEFWKYFPQAQSLLITPNYQSPFKQKKKTPVHCIIEMLELLLFGMDKEKNQIYLEEIKQKNKSYTIDTLANIAESYPLQKLYLLIGQDNLQNFHLWKDYEKILSFVELLVFARETNENVHNSYLPKNKVHYLNNQLIPISSSEVRSSVRNGLQPRFIPSDVYQYILDNNLYT